MKHFTEIQHPTKPELQIGKLIGLQTDDNSETLRLSPFAVPGDDEQRKPSRLQNTANSELILSKEQLYDIFQNILGVKKFEHQLLYNALQVSIRTVTFFVLCL